MRTSESVAELAKDMAKAQRHLENAVKGSTNPHFKSKYADLAAVRDATAPILSNHNLSIVQTTDFDGGHLYLYTRLMHISGEWIESVYPLPFIPDKPQVMGSAITYARRYSWSAICGIASENDDDGEATRTNEGNGSRGADSAWSKRAMDPLSSPGGPSARKSRDPFNTHKDAIELKDNLADLDAYWRANQPTFSREMNESHENRLFINFMHRACEIAHDPGALIKFWRGYGKALDYLRSKDEKEAEVLDDLYLVTVDGFNLTSG